MDCNGEPVVDVRAQVPFVATRKRSTIGRIAHDLRHRKTFCVSLLGVGTSS